MVRGGTTDTGIQRFNARGTTRFVGAGRKDITEGRDESSREGSRRGAGIGECPNLETYTGCRETVITERIPVHVERVDEQPATWSTIGRSLRLDWLYSIDEHA